MCLVHSSQIPCHVCHTIGQSYLSDHQYDETIVYLEISETQYNYRYVYMNLWDMYVLIVNLT